MKRTLALLGIAALSMALLCLSLHGATGNAPAGAAVSIHNGFSPDAVAITLGQSVTWTNDDDRDHDVTADDGSFKSGHLKPGETFTYTFNKVGQHPYGCTLHPRERGVVNVTVQR
ncbi:MAG: cupredoxin domain-containing protein [Tepidisphaeraceae bacterium]